MATEQDLRQQVMTQYPQYAYLLGIKEIAPLLLDAVNPDKGFSPQEFAARLYSTEWWRTHADSVRQWEALTNFDPSTAMRQVASRQAEITDATRQLGLNLTAAQTKSLAEHTLRFGLSPTSAEMRNAYADLFGDYRGGGAPVGSFGEAYNAVRQLAKGDYLVDIADQDAWDWARRIVAGDTTLDSARVAFAALARGKYAHLASQIDQGVAPGQFFAPYRQAIASEMETSADAVDLMDAKWRDVLSVADEKGVRPMTISEATRYARSKKEWEYTSKGTALGAEMRDQLLRTFGAIR